MTYYNAEATRILNGRDFFWLDPDEEPSKCADLCKKLKNFLEPKNPDDKADVNELNADGNTIFHNAVVAVCQCEQYRYTAQPVLCERLLGQRSPGMSYGELVIRYIYKNRADINKPNKINRPPIFYATRPKIIHLMRRLGGKVAVLGNMCEDVNCGNQKITPVYEQLLNGNNAAVAALLQHDKKAADNIEKGFYLNQNNKPCYKEKGYTVYFSEKGGKLRILNIERKYPHKDKWIQNSRTAVCRCG